MAPGSPGALRLSQRSTAGRRQGERGRRQERRALAPLQQLERLLYFLVGDDERRRGRDQLVFQPGRHDDDATLERPHSIARAGAHQARALPARGGEDLALAQDLREQLGYLSLI